MYEDLVRDLRDETCIYHLSRDCLQNIMFAAADAIETMCEMVATAHGEFANVIQSREESKPRWIPVAERLPEPGRYLVCVRYSGNYSDVGVLNYTDNLNRIDKDEFSGKKYKRPGWFMYDSEVGYYETHYNIIAWMSLPEPPKEEE